MEFDTLQQYYHNKAREYLLANERELRRQYWERKTRSQEGPEWKPS